MFCGKCGKEVPEGYEFCMNCGTKLEPTIDYATELIKNKKKKKWIIPVIIILLIVLIASVAVYFMNGNKKNSGLYNDIPWQISYEELCELMETKKTGEIQCADEYQFIVESIEDYKEDKGIYANIIYNCEDDGTLRKIFFRIKNGEDSEYTDSELFDKYMEELSELYGKGEIIPTKSSSIIYSWETPKSLIRLEYGVSESLIIEYQDITYENE